MLGNSSYLEDRAFPSCLFLKVFFHMIVVASFDVEAGTEVDVVLESLEGNRDRKVHLLNRVAKPFGVEFGFKGKLTFMSSNFPCHQDRQ